MSLIGLELLPDELTLVALRREVRKAQERGYQSGCTYFLVRMQRGWKTDTMDLPNFVPAEKAVSAAKILKAIPKGTEFVGLVERVVLVREDEATQLALDEKIRAEMAKRAEIMAMFPDKLADKERAKEKALAKAVKEARQWKPFSLG